MGGGILIGTAFGTVADLFPNPKLRRHTVTRTSHHAAASTDTYM
ncbi:hypothetical protein [Paraburkholderia sp. HD33-4]|nr:hypothetical protein [Paraburkholderia sp. HD33-4]